MPPRLPNPRNATAAFAQGVVISSGKYISFTHKMGLYTKQMKFSFSDRKSFKFTSGSFEELSDYQFGKKVWSHAFCPTCGAGIGAFGTGKLARTSQMKFMMRC